MDSTSGNISLRAAALIAGVAILVMVAAAPFAEVYAYPKLVITGNSAETIKNITANQTFFAWVIFAYALTFICDIIAAWALYIFLKPVNNYLALLAGWFRLVFAAISIVSLLNLTTVFRLLTTPELSSLFKPNQLQAQVMLSLIAFRSGFHFAILFFSMHLALLGILVLRSAYIPKFLGILLIISALGYMASSMQPYLFPNFDTSFAVYTFYGELVFMLWLLIWGSRLKEITTSS